MCGSRKNGDAPKKERVNFWTWFRWFSLGTTHEATTECVERILWNKFTLLRRRRRWRPPMQCKCHTSSNTLRFFSPFFPPFGVWLLAGVWQECARATVCADDDEKNFWQIENLLINFKIIMRDFQFILYVARRWTHASEMGFLVV